MPSLFFSVVILIVKKGLVTTSPRVSKLVILKFVLIVMLLHLLKMGLLLIENNNFIVKLVRNGA
jgi:hypothetical protein